MSFADWCATGFSAATDPLQACSEAMGLTLKLAFRESLNKVLNGRFVDHLPARAADLVV
jgi:hypothetical protein